MNVAPDPRTPHTPDAMFAMCVPLGPGETLTVTPMPEPDNVPLLRTQAPKMVLAAIRDAPLRESPCAQ